ncbi:MAG: hypothetical protein EP343_06385 [Deltaproteobacteria bacterium]|nr:MAG: hypothetical protein EP343_06385 [Deltaproteobacteria bacterium]
MHAHYDVPCRLSSCWKHPVVWGVLLYLVGSGYSPKVAEGKLYAVLIGINQYKNPNIRKLSYAQRDASVLMEYLISSGRVPRNQIRLITGRQATRTRILYALQVWLRQRAKAGDTALIYYSGHGYSHNGISYWVPYDSRYTLRHFDIPHFEINLSLRQLKAQTTLLFLDACHSSFAQRPTQPITRSRPKPRRRKKTKESSQLPHQPFRASAYEHRQGFVVLASSRFNEASCESPTLQHGVFTYALMQALHGSADVDRNGVVTLWEVWRYLQRSVPPLARLTSCIQHPVLLGTLQNQVVLSVPGRRHAIGLSSADVMGRALHIDRKRSVYTAGNFSRYVMFGEMHLQGKGPNSIFVVKHDASARPLWALATQGQGFEQVTDMAVTPDGRVWLTGTFTGTVVFGKIKLKGRGIFLAQISASGQWRWARMLKVKGLLSSARIAVNKKGHCTLISTFSKTIAWDTRSLQTQSPSNAFVASFSSTGALRWLHAMKGLRGNAYGSDVAYSSSGHAVLTGTLFNVVRLGQKSLRQRTIWVANLSSSGQVHWLALATEAWSSAQPFVSSVRLAIDTSRSIYLTGTYLRPLRVGTKLLPLSGTNARFIAKLSAQGQWIWGRSFGGGSSWAGEASLALGPKGNIFIGGRFSGTLQCGSFLLHSQHQQGDGFLARLSPKGNWLWASSIAALPFSLGDLAIDREGAIHILAVHEAQRYQRPPHSLFHILSVRYKTFLWIVPSPS